LHPGSAATLHRTLNEENRNTVLLCFPTWKSANNTALKGWMTNELDLDWSLNKVLFEPKTSRWHNFIILHHYHLSHNVTLLTKIVNLPVSNSLLRGSCLGSKRTRPSRCRVVSCCSYNVTARPTSNFRAARNLTAVAQETGPALRRRRSRFTSSMKFLVACERFYRSACSSFVWNHRTVVKMSRGKNINAL
jgi:hypothetical protein